MFSINTAKQSTTETTPFELVYARPAVMPIESTFPWPPTTPQSHDERMRTGSRWRKVARRHIIIRQRKRKRYSDRFRKPDPILLPGGLVLIARRPKTKGKTKKFDRRFIGPYQIHQRVSATCYVVEDLPCNRKKLFWWRFNAYSSQIQGFFCASRCIGVPTVANMRTWKTKKNTP